MATFVMFSQIASLWVCPPASETDLRRLPRAFQDVSGEVTIRVADHVLPQPPQHQTDHRAPVFVPATAQAHDQGTTAPAQQRQALQQPLDAVTDLHGRASCNRRGLGALHGRKAPACIRSMFRQVWAASTRFAVLLLLTSLLLSDAKTVRRGLRSEAQHVGPAPAG